MTIIDRLKNKIKHVFKKDNKNSESHDLNTESSTGQIKAPVCNTASLKGLTETQKSILEQITRKSTSEQRLVTRSQIIITRDQKLTQQQISRTLNMDRKTVRKWCNRWDEAKGFLNELETKGIPEKDYGDVIAETLNDEPRSGAPQTFMAEQVALIVAMACEVLDDSETSVSHQTQGHLAKEAV